MTCGRREGQRTSGERTASVASSRCWGVPSIMSCTTLSMIVDWRTMGAKPTPISLARRLTMSSAALTCVGGGGRAGGVVVEWLAAWGASRARGEQEWGEGGEAVRARIGA